MQRILFIALVLLTVSCETPQELIKSENVTAKCHCEGSGNYTIVMDAGMGNWSLFYYPVFQKLKRTTRVCLINRAGFAMDSVTTQPRDAKTVALEINNSLKNAGIIDSIILVGHSLGGLHVRMYQSLFPEKVEGMVLLDAAHPKQFQRLPVEFLEMMRNQTQLLDDVIEIAQKGWLKYTKFKIPTFGIPDSLLEAYYSVTTQPQYYYTMQSEVRDFEKSLMQVDQLDSSLGKLPLLVIASKNSMSKDILPSEKDNYPFQEHNRIWLELQKEQGFLSGNSTFVESEKNHYLNLTDSDLVVNEILKFYERHFRY